MTSGDKQWTWKHAVPAVCCWTQHMELHLGKYNLQNNATKEKTHVARKGGVQSIRGIHQGPRRASAPRCGPGTTQKPWLLQTSSLTYWPSLGQNSFGDGLLLFIIWTDVNVTHLCLLVFPLVLNSRKLEFSNILRTMTLAKFNGKPWVFKRTTLRG